MKVTKYIILFILILSVIAGCSKFTFGESDNLASKDKRKENLKIEVLDIGQGDAILIKTREQTVLIDTGDIYHKDVSRGGTNKNIVDMLSKRKITIIDKMIITHPHADHLGGAVSILNNFKVKAVYDNGAIASSKVYRDFLKEMKKPSNQNIEYKHINSNENNLLDFGDGVKFEVFNPSSAEIKKANLTKDKEYNNNSIVGKLINGKFSMLFTGDAEQPAEEDMVKLYGKDLKSNVLKVGHHGSNTSTSKAFLEVVAPQEAIISCGENSKYHHPHDVVIKRLEEGKIKIYATNGNNKFSGGDNGFTIIIKANKEGLISINKEKE